MAKNRLRDLREDSDKTIAETAKIFHLQPTQYRRYEVGESDIPLEWAIKFAEYYNVSLDYLVYKSPFSHDLNKDDMDFIENILKICKKYKIAKKKKKGTQKCSIGL